MAARLGQAAWDGSVVSSALRRGARWVAAAALAPGRRAAACFLEGPRLPPCRPTAAVEAMLTVCSCLWVHITVRAEVLSAAASADAPPGVVTRLLEPLRRPRHRLLLDAAAPPDAVVPDAAVPDAAAPPGMQQAIMETGLFDQSELESWKAAGRLIGRQRQAELPACLLWPRACACAATELLPSP